MNFLITLILITQSSSALPEYPFQFKKITSPVPLRYWMSESGRLSEREKWKSLLSKLQRLKEERKTPMSIALKSALLPGMGQKEIGKSVKAYVFGGGAIIGLLSTVISYGVSESYYNKYMKADNIEDIRNYYDKSNSLYKLSQYTLIGTGGLWLLNILDAYFSCISYNSSLEEELLRLGAEINFQRQCMRVSVNIKF